MQDQAMLGPGHHVPSLYASPRRTEVKSDCDVKGYVIALVYQQGTPRTGVELGAVILRLLGDW